MKTTLFSRIAYKLMVLVIAISYTLTPYVGPSNEDPILTNEKTGANLTAVMWADPQFSNYLVERTRYFDAACEDVTYNIDGKVDAIVSAGFSANIIIFPRSLQAQEQTISLTR